MARTLEQVTRDMLGGYAFQIAQLSAQLEASNEKIASTIQERDVLSQKIVGLEAELAEAKKPRMSLVSESERTG